ncbi:Oligopeptide-binding protein AppA [Neolewinella maritima]|uniref:Oligopeptide-binding protein AppA n=1 Tax=Neolewinella maritima TaxID=1383882 RepID=A0ABN8F4E8_9BACT|nr:ABC transporter substrate-binding protein [Neolewinella maritima]CAH0999640.1 Oligopeptide-binding protein AppA [Neolewinella maritima]
MTLRVLTLTTALYGLFGCTGSGPERSESTLGSTAAAPATEVRICIKAEPVGINPILSVQNISRYVSEQVFQTLNEQDPLTFELIPLLASTPIIESNPEGGTAYRYTIDSLATWPNGTAVTAADVVFSLKALMNPLVASGPYRPYYEMVRDVVPAPDDPRTFRVVTQRSYILAAQAIGDLYIYPEYAYDPEGLLRDIPLPALTDPGSAERLAQENVKLRQFAAAFNDPALGYEPERIVGSGPYRLLEWVDGQYLRLQRRDDYWAGDREAAHLTAVPDELRYVIIPDHTTAINALRDLSLDVMIDMPVEEFQQLRDDPYLTQYYDFVNIPGFKYASILFNQDDPLVADSRVRRALAHTVDVDQLIEQLLLGLARRVVGPVLPNKSYYNSQLPFVDYDLDKATRLLREAGWVDTNGDGTVDKLIDGQRRELSFQLLSYPTPDSEAVTLLVAEGARKVGVEIQVVKREPRSLLSTLDAGAFTASFYGQGFEPTPDDFAQVWLSSSVPPIGTNRGNFENAEADRIIRQIATLTDDTKRAALYRRFQEIIYANQPMIFLYSPYDRVVISKRFNYTLSSIAPNIKFNALQPK